MRFWQGTGTKEIGAKKQAFDLTNLNDSLKQKAYILML